MGLEVRKGYLIVMIVYFLSILISPTTCANSYYADLTIVVDQSGYVTIDGYTNYPNLLVKDSQNYTSKNRSYWLLNISIEENFSEFLYTVILPKDASINYAKSSGTLRITEEQGKLVVKGYGENKKFYILIQYQIEKSYAFSLDTNWFMIAIIVVVSLSSAVLFFYRSRYLKEAKNTEVKDINLKGLNERQKQIVRLLMETDRPLTQTDIQKQLKLPKAAVSRNIRTLEKKGIIEKEKIGMSNLISLRKK